MGTDAALRKRDPSLGVGCEGKPDTPGICCPGYEVAPSFRCLSTGRYRVVRVHHSALNSNPVISTETRD
jgi:hypothetical protein